MFVREVELVIRIDFDRLHFLTTIIEWVTDFRSHLQYMHIQHSQRMRNFGLDIDDDPWSRDVKLALSNRLGDGVNRAFRRFGLKERLRIICDLLATNTAIQRLTVRVPCLCNCVKVDSVANGTSVILDILAPLKRLRVANTTVFEIRHATEHCEGQDCDQNLCNDLIAACVADVGHLNVNGERLSQEEETWKNIKALPRATSEAAIGKVEARMEELWKALNLSSDDVSHFQWLAIRTERYMRYQYQKESLRSA